MMNKKIVYGLVGATASGKTDLSLALAAHMQGEIVIMDSMQIYKGMDIGTAKPTLEEQQAVPHHLIDICDPSDSFSVTEYVKYAQPYLDTLSFPLLVGGTGLYLRSLSLPLDFGFTKGDDEVRENYENYEKEHGREALHALLETVDPVTAEKLHVNDVRRVVRALEVYKVTGKPFSAQQMPSYEDSPYTFKLFAVDMDRALLYERINQRVDMMIKQGLLDEVAHLLTHVDKNAQAMQGLGYKELVPVLQGEKPLDEVVNYLKQKTRNYAKRQLTWFRQDPRIHWISYSTCKKDMLDQILKEI